MQLNCAEKEHIANKYDVSVDSQAAIKTYEMVDSVHCFQMSVLNLSIVYSYVCREHRYWGSETRKTNKQLFCIYLFDGQDTTGNVVCDMDVELSYPYGTTKSPVIPPESYLSRVRGVDYVKKLLNRHVGVHSGFVQQVSRARSYVKSSIYGASKTDSDYCTFVFAGHGIGGALALITAIEETCIAKIEDHCDAKFTVYSYGSPRPGNKALARVLKESQINVKRFVVRGDAMAKLPPKGSRVSCLGGRNRYVHPCSKRRLGSMFGTMCSSETIETLDLYFKVLKAGIKVAEAAEELAEVAESM